MKKHSKILICLVLVVVLLVSAVSLAACSVNSSLIEKRGGNDKAIVLVTALCSGGLYDNKTGDALWDPFYFVDVTLPDVLALLELDDMMGSEELQDVISKVMDTKVDFIKDEYGDTKYNSFLSYVLEELLWPILNYPDADADEDEIAEYVEEYGSLNKNLLHNLSLDEHGNPLNPNIVPTNDYTGPYENLIYGVLGAYKSQVVTLSEKYPDYDVVVFNYDWRLDVEHNEALFEQFLAEKKYSKIVLTTHSLGGQVCNYFLAKSQAHRDMVEAFIMYSPATLGATMALAYLDNLWDALDDFVGMIDGVTDMFGDNAMISTVVDSVFDKVDGLMNYQAKSFLQNMSSVIQLLPSFKLLETYHEAEGIWILKDKYGNDIDTEDKLFDFYYDHDWAVQHNADGTVKMENGKPVLKDKVASLREHQHSLYVEKDGKEVIAADLVNSYYLIGYGQNNTITTYDESIDAGWTFSMDDAKGTVNKYSKMAGDKVVPLYSLLCGHTEAEIEELYGNKDHVKTYAHEHNVVGTDFTNVTGEDVIKIITEIGW